MLSFILSFRYKHLLFENPCLHVLYSSLRKCIKQIFNYKSCDVIKVSVLLNSIGKNEAFSFREECT